MLAGMSGDVSLSLLASHTDHNYSSDYVTYDIQQQLQPNTFGEVNNDSANTVGVIPQTLV